jgi:hypothetical protein
MEDGMNDRQAEAVSNAIGSDVCWLIHGPPGTGKTRVLALRLPRKKRRDFSSAFPYTGEDASGTADQTNA